jgi:hypothetical protein
MNSKVLIIAGMHRSGTSLITQWLHRCGLYIGNRLQGAGVGNVEGHFEDLDFLELHQQLLTARHLPNTGFIDKPVLPLSYTEKLQLQQVIENKNNEKNEWGWKDPRTCLFLKEHDSLLACPFYLIIVRGYHSTVSSLLTREYNVYLKRSATEKGLFKIEWPLLKRKRAEKIFNRYAEFFLKIWIHYYTEILKHTRTLPGNRYLFVHYSALSENDKTVFTRLKNEWQFSLEYFPFANVYKKELLSNVLDVEKYIRDKSLIAKAKEIEKELGNHLMN